MATAERVTALCVRVLRSAVVGQGLVAGFVLNFFLYQLFCERICIKLSEQHLGTVCVRVQRQAQDQCHAWFLSWEDRDQMLPAIPGTSEIYLK